MGRAHKFRFFYDNRPANRATLLWLDTDELAAGYTTYLRATMKPDWLKHIRVGIQCNSNEGMPEKREMALSEFEREMCL